MAFRKPDWETKSEDQKGEHVSRIYWNMPRDRRKWMGVCQILEKEGIKIKEDRARRLGEKYEDAGHVEHIVENSTPGLPSEPQRCPELEKAIQRLFKIRSVLVAESGRGKAVVSKNDDLLHQQLGKMASSLVLSQLRSSDCLGIGSGRGPYYTAVACAARLEGVAKRPVVESVLPLTGRMGVRRWDPGDVMNLDADYIAWYLALILRHGKLGNPPCSTLNVSLAPPTFGKRFRGEWRKKPPTIVLVGVGALAGGHRLANLDLDEPAVKGVRNELTELRRLKNKIETAAGHQSGYHCIGDLCNWLFPVPSKESEQTEDLRKLQRCIDSYNGKIVAPPLNLLCEIAATGAVIAVAGGRHKRHSIRHLLSMETVPISHLVTDDETAQWLLHHRSGEGRGATIVPSLQPPHTPELDGTPKPNSPSAKKRVPKRSHR